MRTAQGPFPMETTYTWQDAGDGATRMTLRNRGEPAGVAKFMGPMVAAAMERGPPGRAILLHPSPPARRRHWRRRRPARRFASIDKEASMALARVVSFDGVSKDRVEEIKREMSAGDGPPEGLPAKEMMMLHDADAEKSLVILFFETEEDYRQGDEALNAMPAGDTPGQRTSVAKYDVAIRMSS